MLNIFVINRWRWAYVLREHAARRWRTCCRACGAGCWRPCWSQHIALSPSLFTTPIVPRESPLITCNSCSITAITVHSASETLLPQFIPFFVSRQFAGSVWLDIARRTNVSCIFFMYDKLYDTAIAPNKGEEAYKCCLFAQIVK